MSERLKPRSRVILATVAEGYSEAINVMEDAAAVAQAAWGEGTMVELTEFRYGHRSVTRPIWVRSNAILRVDPLGTEHITYLDPETEEVPA